MSKSENDPESETVIDPTSAKSWLMGIMATLAAGGLLGKQALRFLRMHLRLAADASIRAFLWRLIALGTLMVCVGLFSSAAVIVLAQYLDSWPLALCAMGAVFGIGALWSLAQARSWQSRTLSTLMFDRTGE